MGSVQYNKPAGAPMRTTWDTDAQRYRARSTGKGLRVFTARGVEIGLFRSERLGRLMMERLLGLDGMQSLLDQASTPEDLERALEYREEFEQWGQQ